MEEMSESIVEVQPRIHATSAYFLWVCSTDRENWPSGVEKGH